MNDRMLDGNVLDGELADAFMFDMSAARGTCDGCGAVRHIGALHVYVDAPGVVVRCPDCQAVMLRFARGGGRLRLDMRGLRMLEVDLP